jgi:hypothetical protein
VQKNGSDSREPAVGGGRLAWFEKAGRLAFSLLLSLPFFFNQPFSSFPSLLQSSTLCGRRRAPIAMRKKCAASRPPTALVSSFSVAFIYGGESSIFYFILKDFIKIFV